MSGKIGVFFFFNVCVLISQFGKSLRKKIERRRDLGRIAGEGRLWARQDLETMTGTGDWDWDRAGSWSCIVRWYPEG